MGFVEKIIDQGRSGRVELTPAEFSELRHSIPVVQGEMVDPPWVRDVVEAWGVAAWDGGIEVVVVEDVASGDWMAVPVAR